CASTSRSSARTRRCGACRSKAGSARRWSPTDVTIQLPQVGPNGSPDGTPAVPPALPVLPLKDAVTFPDTLTPLAVAQPRSVQLVNDVLGGNRMLVMAASR